MTVKRVKGAVNVATIQTSLKELGDKQAKVGWFESARYPKGQPVAYIASIHEFGGGHVPARPFMRPAVAEHGPEWMKLMGQGAKSILRGNHTATQVLEMVSMKAAGDVAKKIQSVSSPPLAASTIARKGNSKLLVETGQMIQSVTGKVE